MTTVEANGDLEFSSEVEKNAYYDELEHEASNLVHRLFYVLERIEAPEGIYMFPDGDTWPAGKRLRVRTSELGTPCNALLPNGHSCDRITCDHPLKDPLEEKLRERKGPGSSFHEKFLTDIKKHEAREKRFEVQPPPANLNSGIRDFVLKLNAAGWKTTDSGDGQTRQFACDRPLPYATIVVKPEHTYQEARRLKKFLESLDCEVLGGTDHEELNGKQVDLDAGILITHDFGILDITLPKEHHLLVWEVPHSKGGEA